MNHPPISRALSLLLALVFLSVAGCKKSSSPTSPSGDGTQSGTPVSNAARQAVFNAVDQAYAGVDWGNPAAAKASLVQLLRSRPEIEEADTNDDASVWGRFTDDRLFIIVNNRKRTSTSPFSAGRPQIPNIPTIAGGELPTSKTATVMNAMGTYFTDTTPLITDMLQAKGYKVSNATPTVANLANVKGDALFYITSHGGRAKLRDRTRIYGVWTATKFDTNASPLINSMWANHEIAYMKATADEIPGTDSATSERRFAITQYFVIYRMSFGQNSFIYIDACSAQNTDFQSACVVSSSGYTAAYAGWTYDSDDYDASVAAYFVIDRLLGTNMDPNFKEDPPQRPFRYPQILQELAQHNLNTINWTKEHRTATFDIQPSSASFGMLAPSIERLTVDEPNKSLTLFGLFGSDQSGATVTINDKPQSISFWSIGEVHCSLPPPGPDESGDVKIIVHGDTSNAVRLTAWKGDVKVNAAYLGSMNYTIDYAFHIRGDVHSFRVDPGGQVQHQALVGFSGMEDSYVRLGAGGTIQHTVSLAGGCTEDLQETWPQGSDSVTSSSTGGKSMVIAGNIDAANKTLTIYLAVGSNSLIVDNLKMTTYCPNSTPQTASFSNPGMIIEFDTLQLQFDDQWNLVASPTITRHPAILPAVYGLDPSLSFPNATVDFSGAPATNPPDPDAGQRPGGQGGHSGSIARKEH